MAEEDKQAAPPVDEKLQALFNPRDPDLWNKFRQYSAMATQGINSMPFVFGRSGGSYADLAGKSPQDIMNLFYGGGMSWGSPSGGGGGGMTSSGMTSGGMIDSGRGVVASGGDSAPAPFDFSRPSNAIPEGLYTKYGLFSGRDAFGNPIGNTPLTVSWMGAPQQVPAWATNQAAATAGLGGYQAAGINPPPSAIQQANDHAMQIWAASGYSPTPPNQGRQG